MSNVLGVINPNNANSNDTVSVDKRVIELGNNLFFSEETTQMQDVLDRINQFGFELLPNEELYFSLATKLVKFKTSYLVNKLYAFSKNSAIGVYGNAGVYGSEEDNLITADHLIEFRSEAAYSFPTDSVFFDLGDLEAVAVQDFLNSAPNNSYALTALDTDYFFKAVINGVDQLYKFVGNKPKTLGNNNVTVEDFDLITTVGSSGFITNLSQLNDDIGATEDNIIKVVDKSQIINQELDTSKKYEIRKSLALVDGEFINMDNSPLIEGLGADFTNISTSSPTGIIFKSQTAQNINIKNISLSALVDGSKVFDLKDQDADFDNDALGTHEFRLVGVNFTGCKDLGVVNGFRQWYSVDLGLYGCADGIELQGVWNGIVFDKANMFGISPGATFFKQGANLSFLDRCIIQSNFNVPEGVTFMDFMPSVFQDNEALQINNTVAKIDGVKSNAHASTLFPNIGANNPKSLWGINTGLPSTASDLIVIDDDVSGTYAIDWLNSTYDLTLTGDTVFTEINLPASGRRTKLINITISGNYNVTFPDGWENQLVGAFKGADLNSIAVRFVSTGKYTMRITNSLSVYPAPYLELVNPVYIQPDSTSNELTLIGSFFTPATLVEIENQTIFSQEFKNSGKIVLGVNGGSAEGDVFIKISNGTERIFEGYLTISLGEVVVPTQSDWYSVTSAPNLENNGDIKITSDLDGGSAGIFDIPTSEDFQIRFKTKTNPLSTSEDTGTSRQPIEWYQGGVKKYEVQWYQIGAYTDSNKIQLHDETNGFGWTDFIGTKGGIAHNGLREFYIEKIGSTVTLKETGVVESIAIAIDLVDLDGGNISFVFNVKSWDYVSIKKIKLT